MTEPIDESILTTSKSEAQLNTRELEMYREYRRDLLTWVLNKGRATEMNVGYAEETVENRIPVDVTFDTSQPDGPG